MAPASSVAFGISELVSFHNRGLGFDMHRMIARVLLLFALVGNLGPIVFAATAAPHACCLRKGIHHCQESSDSDTGQPVIRDASCCKGDCCRAVTTGQWAHAQPKAALFCLATVSLRLSGPEPNIPVGNAAGFQSSRAPPAS
jgi:hypothetical protein